MSAALTWGRAEIRRSWGSLLVVAILIAIAGGAVMAGVAGARRAGTAVDRFVASSDLASVVIYTDDEPDRAVRGQLERDTRVEYTAEGRILAITPAGVVPAMEGAMWVMPSGALAGQRTPRVLAGRLPHDIGEVALDSSTAAQLGLDVGSPIALQSIDWRTCFGGSSADCGVRSAGSAVLVGVIRTDQDIVPDPDDWTLLIAAEGVVGDDIVSRASMGSITSIWPQDGADPDEIVEAYAPLVRNGDVTNDADEQSGILSGARRAAQLEHDAVLVATVIAALASVAMIGQAHARYLARRRSDVDALLAAGMTRPERATAAWLPGLVSSVVGATLAVPVAALLSPVFPLSTARIADPDVGVRVDTTVIVAGAAIVALVGSITAFASSWSWSRRETVMRSDRISAGARLAERLQLGPAAATGVRFSLEPRAGSVRLPVRSAVVGATAAIVVVTAGLIVTSSLDRALGVATIHGITWDLEVSSGPDPAPAEDFVANDDRIESATFIKTGELNVARAGTPARTSAVIGVDELKGRFEYTVLDGRSPTGTGEVAFSTAALRRTGAAVGDEVELSGPTGSRWVVIVGRIVIATAEGSTSNGIVADMSVLDELGGSEQVAEIDVQPAVLLALADPNDVAQVKDDVETAGAPTDVPTRPTEVGLLDDVRLVPTFVAAFVAFLGALAVFHALWTTARRRRHDVMVLRALGCRPREGSAVARWNGAILAIVALVVGIPVGVLSGRAIWTSIAAERDLVVQVDVPWLALLAVATSAVIGAAFALASAPARTLSRRYPGRELRTE